MLDIALVTLGSPERLTGGYLYHRRMADMAAAHDARIQFVSFPPWPFPSPALVAPLVLRRAQSCGARVLLLDSIAAAFLGPHVAIFPPSLPLIAVLHQPPGGIDHRRLRASVQARLDRAAYRRARRLLVASDSLAGDLAARGIRRELMRVVPPGRDVAAATSGAPALDLRQGRRVALLSVGNWVERKGLHLLLAAVARLPAGTATLHLVGDDGVDPHYAGRVRALLAQPSLRGRVVVHGPLPAGEVAALYRDADVFVLPSLREPYGTVYGEAMSAGLPVVGWRAGNLPYLADSGREGILVEPGDVDGLAGALFTLAENKRLRRKLGQAAARRAVHRPTWRQSAGLFFGAIREVVEDV